MDPLRFAPRPMSPSSVNTRSSFNSRTRSPLSISSSIDPETGRLSEDSISTNSSLSSYNGKPDLAPTRMPAKTHWLQKAPEGTPVRYGAGGMGRQQQQQQQARGGGTLLPPQRMGAGPQVRRAPALPGETFRKLPEEVLLVILAELKKLHLGRGSLSCSTCWMREVLNLGMGCRKWWNAAKIALYEDIQLIGNDSLVHTKKKYKMKHGTRLKLLRRTLRGGSGYAQLVKSLKVPAIPETAKTREEQSEYMDLVASLIMACPNLERLPGFYPTYAHEFSKYMHALSTRTKLQDMVWIVNPSRFQRQHRYKLSEDMDQITQAVTLAPGPLLPQQSVDFLTYHSCWSNLRTLFLHCNPAGMIDSLLFEDVFYSLPQLENLYISDFPMNAFNDSTLVNLPPLKSLRLDRLPGITSEGLSAFAPRQRHTLKSLSLVQVPLLDLQVFGRMLSNFRVLTRLTISQGPAPTLPPGEVIFLHPYLASYSLEYLHWELINPDNDKATGILSKSIAFGGFPSLKTIRAPTDFEGLLQMHCRPRDKIELASDKYRNLGSTPSYSHPGLPHSHSTASLPSPTKTTFGNPPLPSPTRSTFSLGHGSNGSVSSLIKSPTRSVLSAPGDYFSIRPTDDLSSTGLSLATARRMAQSRLEAATHQPQFHIIVWDEYGQFLERFEVGGYMGQVSSKINYTLKPDIDGMDEAVVQFEGTGGLLDGSEETSGREGCTGSWCLDVDLRKTGRVARKKEDWWHTERGRWKPVPLEKFF